MESTENLALPYIMPGQAQKHVTHNEALRMLDAIVQLAVADKDLDEPPSSPAPGVRYIVGAAPIGAWSGHADEVAAWQDGAWAFHAPAAGWLAWVHDEDRLYLFGDGGWAEAPGSGEINPAPLVGVNATADTTNRLAVSSPATLLGHEGDDHRLKINKAAAGDTASVLFQTGFVGHAEFGLTGDDDWHVKVSPDGAAWHEAIVVDRATGAVSLPSTAGGGGWRELLTEPRTYHVDAGLGDDANDGLSPGAGAFATIQKAIDTVATLDLGIHDVTIGVADGTYGPIVLKQCVGAGGVSIVGNAASPWDVVLTRSDNNPVVLAQSMSTQYVLRGLRLQTTAGSGSNRIGMQVEGAVTVTFGRIDFGSGLGAHINATRGAEVRTIGSADGDYFISGGIQSHVTSNQGAQVNCGGRTVTFRANVNFSQAFMRAIRQGGLSVQSMIFDLDGHTVTGARFMASQLGLIFTNGAGATYLPGDASGTEDTATSGHYV